MAKNKNLRESETSAPENTKELLVQAAKHLFASKGYDGTTVKDIADRAGVNISLVSYHFNGKEGLYRTCILEFGQSRLDAAQRVLQVPSSYEECRVRMQMFVEEMMSWMMANPECCQMIQREAELGLPVAQDVFESTFLQVFVTLKKFIAASQEKGFLNPEFDPHLAASLFHMSLVHITQMDKLGARFFGLTLQDEKYQKKVKDHLIEIFLKGLAGAKHQARGE
ncbi:MAG TPA: TetR family transcriptional regulator [Bdellovibrionales bacterium]|nr:TetR family transcriptional regulator [Bdellovibrionales bacterium]